MRARHDQSLIDFGQKYDLTHDDFTHDSKRPRNDAMIADTFE